MFSSTSPHFFLWRIWYIRRKQNKMMNLQLLITQSCPVPIPTCFPNSHLVLKQIPNVILFHPRVGWVLLVCAPHRLLFCCSLTQASSALGKHILVYVLSSPLGCEHLEGRAQPDLPLFPAPSRPGKVQPDTQYVRTSPYCVPVTLLETLPQPLPLPHWVERGRLADLRRCLFRE